MSILDGFPPPNLDEMIQKTLSQSAILQASPSYGDAIGGRLTAICTIEHDSIKWVVEIFSEIFIRKPPMNVRLGYTVDEIETTQGVYLSKVIGKSKMGERLNGLFLSSDDFQTYIKDGAVRVIFHRFLDELSTRLQPDEEDAQKYSSIYLSRPVGVDLFRRSRLLC